MSETAIDTYQDAVEHLLDVWDLDRTARNLRMARRAVVTAYRDIPTLHRWSYFTRRVPFTTEASQSFTASYDHTGGTYERTLTISSGSWPTNAALGRVILNNIVYDIAERKSSTVVTLKEDNNPGSDLTSESCTWFRSVYTLPVRFLRSHQVVDPSTGTRLYPITPAKISTELAGNYTPGSPDRYAIHNASEYYGSVDIELMCPPSTATTYEMMAEVAPRQLRTEVYSTGTVSVTAGSASLTSSGAAFSALYAGSIIRFSSDGTNLPTGFAGSITPDPDGLLNPYFAQRVILSVDSATTATLDAAASSSTTLTAVKYTISDPIDLDPNIMTTLFQRMTEREMARLVRSQDLPLREASVQQALIQAAGADNRTIDLGGTDDYAWSGRLSDIAIIE